MSVWAEIHQLTGQTLSTLDQRKAFDVVAVTEQAVMVRPLLSVGHCPTCTGLFYPVVTPLTQPLQNHATKKKNKKPHLTYISI